MPVSDLHRRVAAVALAAAAEHGFALGGGNALLAHGVIDRPTQDVDVFSDEQGGVEAAARLIVSVSSEGLRWLSRSDGY